MINNQFPNAAQPVYAAPFKPAGHTNVIKIVLGIAASLIALLLGLIVLLLIGFETGPVALLIGMICATIPVPIYVTLVLWIDRYESEPLWLLISAFCWGAFVAVFVAFVLNTAGVLSVALVTHNAQAAQTSGAVIFAPIVEESAKA